MADLQLRQGEEYYAQSQSGKQRTITLKGERGKILDTNGLPLAYNQKSYDVEFMRDPTRNKAADNLCLLYTSPRRSRPRGRSSTPWDAACLRQ